MLYKLLAAALSMASLTSIALTNERETPCENRETATPTHHKMQILYLAKAGDYSKAIDLYQTYYNCSKTHDFAILEELGITFLEDGSRSPLPEVQLMSIFGTGIAGLSSSWHILERGIASPQPQTQLATLQVLARIQDDRSEQLLTKAMASDFLQTRLEASFILSLRKSHSATGQIEALMYRLPHPMRYFFPEFFAIIGTSDAVSTLRHLMNDSFHAIRIEAILSAARHGRDDLLPTIRSAASHINVAEQEACASALGYLKDSKSIKRLKKLSHSSSTSVQLAALRSLHLLGDNTVKEKILKIAQEKNVFAIALLGDIEGGEEILSELSHEDDIHIRFNSMLSLLKRKDRRALHAIKEFLLRDSKDLGYQPQTSIGSSLKAWKVIPSLAQHLEESFYDLRTLSISVRERMLTECLELQESDFLQVATLLFEAKQHDLIPLLVTLLENLQTPAAISLLKEKMQTAGAPFIRTYCNLALFRLKQPGPYEENITSWIKQNMSQKLIEFRPTLPWNVRLVDNVFTMTPEESSGLLIQCYEALAQRHDEKSIDFLLTALKEGNPKNRAVVAGILVRALQ